MVSAPLGEGRPREGELREVRLGESQKPVFRSNGVGFRVVGIISHQLAPRKINNNYNILFEFELEIENLKWCNSNVFQGKIQHIWN